MFRETIEALGELVLLLVDIGLILTCSCIHFMRGNTNYGISHGIITLLIFFIGGITTSIFHYVRHELPRKAQRSKWKQYKAILLMFVPSYYIIKWNILRCAHPGKLTVRCWTASLRLFHCSIGSLIQAIFQAYLVVLLWWEEYIPAWHVRVMMAAAIFLCLHATYGICSYTFVQYYDEIHSYLPAREAILIIIALLLNIGGRVSGMSVVMVTLRWELQLLGPGVAFFINLVTYFYNRNKAAAHRYNLTCICQYLFLFPLAFLSTMTMSDQRFLTAVTSLVWVVSYLPQIIFFHEEVSNILVWLVPTLAQIVALVIMLWTWKTFEAAFERFQRLAKMNHDVIKT